MHVLYYIYVQEQSHSSKPIQAWFSYVTRSQLNLLCAVRTLVKDQNFECGAEDTFFIVRSCGHIDQWHPIYRFAF